MSRAAPLPEAMAWASQAVADAYLPTDEGEFHRLELRMHLRTRQCVVKKELVCIFVTLDCCFASAVEDIVDLVRLVLVHLVSQLARKLEEGKRFRVWFWFRLEVFGRGEVVLAAVSVCCARGPCIASVDKNSSAESAEGQDLRDERH